MNQSTSWLDVAAPTPSQPADLQQPSEKPKSKGCIMVGAQPIHTLTTHWREEIEAYQAEMQEYERKVHGNDDITENGIHRRVIMTDELGGELSRIAMFQPFTPQFVKALFSNIHVAFIGDSLARGLYKDMVSLIQTVTGNLCPDDKIKGRLEPTWYEDRLLDYDDPDEKTEYMEFREYLKDEHLVQFMFTTRVYNDRVGQLLAHFEQNKPDVVVIHSNIWDATRYAYDDRIGLTQFALRLSYLCQRLKEILEPTAVVIFVLMPPAAYEQSTDRAIKKGFFGYFVEQRMREINRMVGFTSSAISYFAAQIVSSYGFDVLDLNHHFQQDFFASLRAHDGLHYVSLGVRIMTQTLIGHIIKAWDVDLPSEISERLQRLQVDYFEEHVEKLEESASESSSDSIAGAPDCYRRLLKLGKRLFSMLKEENSQVSKLIQDYRGKLLNNMRSMVKDDFLRRYTIDLKGLAKARPADRVRKMASMMQDMGGMGMKGPGHMRPGMKPSKRVEEPEEDVDDAASDRSVSPTRDPDLKAQFDEMTDEEKEFLSKVHTDDALWMELWRNFFDYTAISLGLAPDDLDEDDSDFDDLDLDLGEDSTETDEGTSKDADELPANVTKILGKLFEKEMA